MKKIFALILALAAIPVVANAASQDPKSDPKQFTIDENTVEVVELTPIPNENYNRVFRRGEGGPTGGATIPSPSELPQAPSAAGGAPYAPGVPSVPGMPSVPQTPDVNNPTFMDNVNNSSAVVDLLDRIVNLVDKIFTVIAKGQPVVNINVNYANAVPYGVTHWTQLQGWKEPKIKRYAFYAKNLYGMKVVDVEYQVHYTYGGNLNGRGHFLTGVTVEPIKVDTAWGYNVDMTAEVPDSTIANVGTSEDPIAAMQVQIRYTIHTIIKDSQGRHIYYVRGDGGFKDLTGKRTVKSTEKIVPNEEMKKNVEKKIRSIKF